MPIDPTAPEVDEEAPIMQRWLKSAMLDTTYAQVNAATLIFYHSILDGVVFDCLRVTALRAPSDWEKELSGMQVGLLEARDRTYEQLLRAEYYKRLAELEREALLTKVGKLFARCKPEPKWSPMHGYAYDETRIKQFDDQRHEIVHGTAIGKPLAVFPRSLTRAFSTSCERACFLLAHQHAVRDTNRPSAVERGSPRHGMNS